MTDVMQTSRGAANLGVQDEGEDWPAQFFRDVDVFDIDVLAAWLADDVEVRFGNTPPIHGKAAAVQAFAGFWGTIAGMRHARETVVRLDNLATQQSVVTYTTLDGRDVSMPVASHMRRTDSGQLDRLWIYIDMAPLFGVAT